MSATYYQPSGKISIVGVLGGLVVGGAISLAIAFLYAVVLVYNPVLQLAVLLPFLFGAATGALTALVARKLKQRNRYVAVALALTTTGVAYLFCWLPWMYFTLRHVGGGDLGLFDLLDPFVFFSVLAEIYSVGAWSIGSNGSAVSGVMLGVCWLAEALIVLAMACVTGWAQGVKGIFCEGCDSWCDEAPGLLRFSKEAERELARRLRERDLSAIGQMPRAGFGDSEVVELTLSSCPGCGQTNTLLLERCTTTRDQRGNPIVTRMPLVPWLLVRRDEAAWVRSVR